MRTKNSEFDLRRSFIAIVNVVTLHIKYAKMNELGDQTHDEWIKNRVLRTLKKIGTVVVAELSRLTFDINQRKSIDILGHFTEPLASVYTNQVDGKYETIEKQQDEIDRRFVNFTKFHYQILFDEAVFNQIRKFALTTKQIRGEDDYNNRKMGDIGKVGPVVAAKTMIAKITGFSPRTIHEIGAYKPDHISDYFVLRADIIAMSDFEKSIVLEGLFGIDSETSSKIVSKYLKVIPQKSCSDGDIKPKIRRLDKDCNYSEEDAPQWLQGQ